MAKKVIDPGGSKLIREQKREALVNLIQKIVLSAESKKIFEITFNSIASGMSTNRLPDIKDFEEDVLAAFKEASALVYPIINELTCRKVYTDAFHATACLIISAYGKTTDDSASKLNEICGQLEKSLM